MSTFQVTVRSIDRIDVHPNADALEFAVFGGYRAIVQKNKYQAGDLVAYIPEASLLPDSLVEEMGLAGKLSGKDKNRVKAIRLRGELSQGLVYPAREGWMLGQDVTEELGITKWEPEIPVALRGQVFNAGSSLTIKYDIENLKNFPDVFSDGDDVVFTEKLHGTWCQIMLAPISMVPESGYDPDFYSGEHGTMLVVSSKGQASKGLALKINEDNKDNLYVKTALSLDLCNKHFLNISSKMNFEPVTLIGEIFGQGVQDLHYGNQVPQFRVFDVFVGTSNNGYFLNDRQLDEFFSKIDIPRVPVLYRGPFSQEKVQEFTDGKDTLSGTHVREGIVIRSTLESSDTRIPACHGRLQLKSVSGDYLTRKGKVTEYQ